MTSFPTIKISRPGTFRSAEGATVTFTSSDFERTVAAYDGERNPAPLVIGHPVFDAPAYGWIGKLAYDGDYLTAQPSSVVPTFAEAVRDGSYGKVSASFYPPSHPYNPAPGVHYHKHLGFLGAQAPAVKGLGLVSFAAAAEGLTFEMPIQPLKPRAEAISERAAEIRKVAPAVSLSEAFQMAGQEVDMGDQLSEADATQREAIRTRLAVLRMQNVCPGMSFAEARDIVEIEGQIATMSFSEGDDGDRERHRADRALAHIVLRKEAFRRSR